MSMYALQVMTGMEAEITRKLRGKGVDARCLQERRMIRRGGKWQEQLYTLFPSYIFVSTPDVYRVYYAVCHEDGVLHWLGATKGTPEALSAHEEANILWLAGDGPLPPSEAEMQADGTLDFTSGPLAHLKDMLEKVNRHDRRVTVRVPVGGEDKTITLSYRLNGRQQCYEARHRRVVCRMVWPRPDQNRRSLPASAVCHCEQAVQGNLRRV